MVSITFVVGILFVGMMWKSVALQEQLTSYDSQIKDLDRQIEEEEGRTTEIDDLKDYMKTDEYVEETAREKLGLVKENGIVFKEGEAEKGASDTGSSQGTHSAGDTQDSEDTGGSGNRQNTEDSQTSGDSQNGDTSRQTAGDSEEAEG